MGYCLNVMRGCLASMAEIDAHWREFVHSLEGLSLQMHGPQDLEQVLLGAHTLIHDAVGYAQKNGPRLSAQVRRGCLMLLSLGGGNGDLSSINIL